MLFWNFVKIENYFKDVDYNIWILNRQVKGVLNIIKFVKN